MKVQANLKNLQATYMFYCLLIILSSSLAQQKLSCIKGENIPILLKIVQEKISNFVSNMNIPFQRLYLKYCIIRKMKMKSWKNK